MYLYGASGHAKVIMDILVANDIHIDALVDDNAELKELQGIPVIHSAEGCSPFIISIGSNKIRKVIAERLNCEFISAIHPSAIISPFANIAEGTVVVQGAIVQTDVKIGKHCIINTAATVDHECVIEDYVHISPNASLCGNVQVGEGSWIGAGATVIPGVKIGKWCVIGAGSVIIKDVPDNVIVTGVPGKFLNNNDVMIDNQEVSEGGGNAALKENNRREAQCLTTINILGYVA